jgi:NADPH-dependent 2,4-dienoyl-CoA reductase/sulfur reductase-like enzyme/peroxiredoxin family protein/TusA-related sulfurtransferase/rhodanese-related sulfurtransferase
MGKKILVVGGVAGGASCAARLRRLDETNEIIVFERGDYVSYANCGLPYHVGDVIKDRDDLLLQTPMQMRAKYNADVRIKQEVVSIDRVAQTVTVKHVESGETYTESYDTLVLSTGSSPMRPPIPGIDSKRIMTLWTVPDTDRIRETISTQSVQNAVVIGGGFIGLEMAENLHHAGLNVTVVEALPQVMAPLDFEMAQFLHEHMAQKGVKLYLNDGVAAFEESDGAVKIKLKSGREVSAELVILSIGVRPNSELAKAAGLALNARGGIMVDDYMKTSDPNIYAVGDVIEVEDFVDKSRTMIPLAGPANKQGRIAADNIMGANERYEGTQGTSVAKVFDLTAASTGANEKTLANRGLVKGKDFEAIIITQNSHAGYYPGAVPLTIKLIFSKDGKKIYGAQIVGIDGVDKRIDTIAVTIRLGGGIHELKSLELAYAPPYSSAKDPVNMAGFVAENVVTGKAAFVNWDAMEHLDEDTAVLDVREAEELVAFSLPTYTHIPLGQLRQRLGELDKSKKIIVFCAVGIRAWNAARILMNNGFSDVKLYPSGTRFYQTTHYKDSDIMNSMKTGTVSDSGHTEKTEAAASIRLDCSGLQCPGPIMKVFETMKNMKDGEVMQVSASDPGFARDIGAWTRRTGNTLIANEKSGSMYVATIKKGGGDSCPIADRSADGKTIIVFSGDLDRVLASFIIANGAAAMGRPVTMFFTFWGLNVLRRSNRVKVQKSFIESMFGGMMPRGVNKLKLSKMHMAGMGTSMMKGIMKKKNVDSLEELIKKAMKAGVKIVACTMSMDVMGIREEELIDGVELGGVGAYLGDAEESNVNLFI